MSVHHLSFERLFGMLHYMMTNGSQAIDMYMIITMYYVLCVIMTIQVRGVARCVRVNARLGTRQEDHQDQVLFKGQSSDAALITTESIKSLESVLDNGASVAALRRFNTLLAGLPADSWEEKLAPVMNELAYNLESFNPAFTAVLLRVQSTIGKTDYVRRDTALKNLIQPLAGEYGMHNGEDQARTHRELFSVFYADLMKQPLESVLASNPEPHHSKILFENMMRDLSSGMDGPVELASYALGYNLAIEYLADYEKTWMLDAFRELNARVLEPQGRPLTEWLFLEVHAEGEAEHAALGHAAVAALVPASHEGILLRAMQDHDRDFSAFYNHMADMLE
jgi:hypothetical protein